MGGNRQKKGSSLFSIFSIFKSRRSRDDIVWDEPRSSRKVRPSEEDKGNWVAEPGIDRKASAFIAKFYESRVSDPECQTITPV
ncbi:hypothetical protein Scep_030926 [Stephania cephalantha]|uniref:Uncharacterized protein n=1 Tax=Stephania cephalantha TaxID=152367 RepID=A0AAP0E3C9_9MAGN